MVNVSSLKKPILYQKILKILQDGLVCDYPNELQSLAAHVCNEQVERPLKDILNVFYHHGFTVPQLLSVLLNCESMRMKRLFSGYSSQPVAAQYKDLQHVIHHFNDLQEEVLDVGKGYLLQAEAALFSNEDESSQTDRLAVDHVDEGIREEILDASLRIWERTKKMKVYNFFQGVPVYATVEVLRVESHCVYVSPNSDLIKVFSSHPNGNSAYGICANEKEQVRVSIGEVLPHSVQLNMREVAQSLLNCRKNLGVRMNMDVFAEIKVRGKLIKKVLLRDISVAGLGLSIHGLDKEPCRTGEVIECRFDLGSKHIVAHGWVRWVVVMNDEIRLGMELRPHIAIQQALQKEVFQIQRKIIVKLNDLDVPTALEAVIL
ncbi:MAG: PilZ domain-containing protein [Mariprofundaceae bacterium]|nr:PilZ domain-containing protein [Mariprofundaceae bacterium]